MANPEDVLSPEEAAAIAATVATAEGPNANALNAVMEHEGDVSPYVSDFRDAAEALARGDLREYNSSQLQQFKNTLSSILNNGVNPAIELEMQEQALAYIEDVGRTTAADFVSDMQDLERAGQSRAARYAQAEGVGVA